MFSYSSFFKINEWSTYGWDAFLAIATGCKNSKQITSLICYSNFAEGQMMVVHKFLSLSRDDALAGSTNESDVGCRCNSQGAMTIGGSSKSQVSQREEQASLHIAASIQMAGLYANLCTSITFCYLYYLYPILPSELVMQEEIL